MTILLGLRGPIGKVYKTTVRGMNRYDVIAAAISRDMFRRVTEWKHNVFPARLLQFQRHCL